jgi:hypothetical protein
MLRFVKAWCVIAVMLVLVFACQQADLHAQEAASSNIRRSPGRSQVLKSFEQYAAF